MEPARPLPILDDLSTQVFEAAANGELIVQECLSCRHRQFYPRAHCLSCFSTELGWLEASGDAVLHTFSIVYRTPNSEFAEDVPYVFAIVDLAEGVRMTSRVIDTPLDEVACGMRLRAKHLEVAPDLTMVFFTAAPSR